MSKYDWDYWRHRYVTGDDSVTLAFLSSVPGAPRLQSLKNRGHAENWTEQRKQFRYQVSTKIEAHAEAQAVTDHVAKLVDVAELVTRQSKISKAFQGLSARWLQQADPSQLKGSEAIAMFRDAAKIEQLLAGLATEHQDITSGGAPLAPTRIEIVAPNVHSPD